MKKDKISLKDIANSLGVSTTLVSLVLNNKGEVHGISKETQAKVIAKAKELNYMPSFMARGLRTGRSFTIGVVVSDISNPFYSRMVRYMEDEASKNGYTLLISSSDESHNKESKLLKMLIDRQVDGLIISSSQPNLSFLSDVEASSIPYVLIDRVFEDNLNVNTISVDNIQGSYKAVEHLVSQGYKKIAMLAVTPIYVSTIRERIDGYLRSVDAFNLEYGSELLVELDFYNLRQSILNIINSMILKPEPEIDAIFAINNNVAVECLKSFKELGIEVPQNLGFISFDDIDLYELTSPSVSAIAQPLETLSTQAVNMIIQNIENKTHEFQQMKLDTELIIRESTLRE